MATKSLQPMVVEHCRTDYTAKDAAQLREDLLALDEQTVTEPIGDVEDILLDAYGRRQADGYALTRLSFAQLCKHTAPGLNRLVSDISGINRRQHTYDEVIDPALGARIINECVKLRFRIRNGLMGRQLILDNARQTVEGIVGPGYKYLAHHRLYDAVAELLAANEPPAVFYSACLLGRRLDMTFRFEQPIFQLANGDAFGGGYYFGNSEAGEVGVQTAAMITLYGTPYRCVGPLEFIAHAGKGFMKRLGRLLGDTLIAGEAAQAAGEQAQRLLSASLEILDDAAKIKRARCRRIEDMLRFAGVDRKAAEFVTRWAIYAGGQGATIPSSVRAVDLKSRTWYDIFLRLVWCAARHPPGVREAFERGAYDLLTGKIRL